MNKQQSGAGQPDRTLALLWRNHRPAEPNRKRGAGRRPSLDLDDVVLTAIRLADEHGLTAASMGGVAKELGVGTMTLYTYVPSKEELLDLMVDQVMSERELPGPGERPDDWREQIEIYSGQTRAMFQRHLWLSQISTIRPPVGPAMLAAREYLLAAMLVLGLSAAETNTAALAITTYIDSAAGLEAESRLIERTTGQANDAWWHERNDLWETYFDVERHPAMTTIWNAKGYQSTTQEAASESYRYGLDRLLDGIQAQTG
ncbi:TetR/AcrR family transcriptional regulator [Kribbella solani]|uniref:AcrR family transcriptional regulator n=1 Tax=Kribbella solani TaxID=236067 RepID=A0A841DVC3_9ACTN|nr:TetR/AcrR family transcriptional regulator C-terminal domain-containing protein [Kribbella solani]MBB5983054.1 AcrR family transcriptional regulator [Kribbella solani]MDX2972718.1 TetR/AcrR family transcriptional regulator [Kribbella solani]MDX3000666.1 TetR/AcrR family transcriptional regulator [Kribbella solani]